MNVIALLPKHARVVEHVPKKLVHTASKHLNDPVERAIPYVAALMLGRSNYVASCWTSFGQTGAMMHGGIAKITRVIR